MEYAFLLALVPAFLVVGLVTGGSSDDDLDDMDHASSDAQDSDIPVVPLHSIMFEDDGAADDAPPPPPQA